MPRSLRRLLRCVPLLALVAAALIAGPPPPAWGYVPSLTKKSKTPLSWHHSNCIFIRINSAGSADLNDGSDIAAVKRSLENWRSATRECSYLRFELLDESPDASHGVKIDGSQNENVVVWQEEEWAPGDSNAAALTILTYIDQPGTAEDGQILDADIVLNGVNFTFATDGSRTKTDIENTMTHELGHLMGLDHTCNAGTPDSPELDADGNPVPACQPTFRLPSEIKEATMYNYTTAGDTDKRSPEADDIRGICETYPLAQDPGICRPAQVIVQDGGCSITAKRRDGLAALAGLLLLLVGLLILRRRPLRS